MTENFRKRTSIAVVVRGTDMTLNLQEPVESAVFRVIQEALTNIEKHARATRVEVNLRCIDDDLHVTIQDDGIGLSPESDGKPGCYGLIAMQERIFVLGGTIAIRNTKPRGLAIHASIPIDRCPFSRIANL
jgi:signal transduction histidine kinase